MDCPKVLYLGAGADADHNGVFGLNYNSLPQCLADTIRRVKYVTISSMEQICQEIRSVPTIKDVVLGFHGAYNAMQITATSHFWVFNQILSGCFDSLPPDGRIFLQSCSTGEHSFRGPNIGEWLSWISGREVIAPSDLISPYAAKCMKEGGRLNIEFWDRSNTTLLTQHFNTATSAPEMLLFGLKTASSSLMGAMVVWQTMRVAASLMQGSGAAAGWVVDTYAPQMKRIAESTGAYNPKVAEILYAAAKAPFGILKQAGSLIHRDMDLLIHPINTAFQNSAWGAAQLGYSAAMLGIRGIQHVASKFF